jgi:hypothetical protein
VVALLAEPDFEEHQQQAAREAGRHEADCQDLSSHSLDECGTSSACDDQRGG